MTLSPYGVAICTAWKNSRFILSEKLDFHMVDNLLITVHAFPTHILTSLSVDEILLPRYVKGSINFRGLSFSVETALYCLKS